jgi:hypothetical protein
MPICETLESVHENCEDFEPLHLAAGLQMLPKQPQELLDELHRVGEYQLILAQKDVSLG